MTGVSKRTTLNANGVHLRYLVGNGTERRNRSERNAFVIHIEPGNYDSYAIVRQLVAKVYKSFVQELCLVYAYNIYVGSQQQYVSRRIDRSRVNGVLVVAHYIFFRIAHIDSRLEYLYLLPCKLSTPKSAD